MISYCRCGLAFVLALALLAAAPAQAEELKAEVTKLTGDTVEVRLQGGARASVGDAATIGFVIEGVGLVPLKGKWKVTAVQGATATLSPDGEADQPRVGQVATITHTARGANDDKKKGGGKESGTSSKTPPASPGAELSSRGIMFVQEHLAALGYDPGPADGKMGRRTRAAIIDFQLSHNLPTDGRATQSLLNKLRSTPPPEQPKGEAPGKKLDEEVTSLEVFDELRSDEELKKDARDYRFGRNGKEKDLDRVFQINQILAKRGDRDAVFGLGTAYAFGQGAEKDMNRAFDYFEQAAERGHSRALFNMAIMYQKGIATEEDAGRAYTYMFRAADTGLVEAAYGLGTYLEEGYGTKQDRNAAIRWYRKAAEQGYEKAENRLKKMGVN